jgi:glycosyltransferase involved in cell wall biosynthesis
VNPQSSVNTSLPYASISSETMKNISSQQISTSSTLNIFAPKPFRSTVSTGFDTKDSHESNMKCSSAIEAFRKNGKRLVIIGGGQDEKKLKQSVPSNIEFLGGRPRAEIAEFYKKARAFIFPGLEDFGITPVESQGYCTPVIAFGEGGALETVVDGKTGVFFPNQTVESLNDAISRFEKLTFSAKDFQKNINRFTEEKFINEIKNQVDRQIREN